MLLLTPPTIASFAANSSGAYYFGCGCRRHSVYLSTSVTDLFAFVIYGQHLIWMGQVLAMGIQMAM